MILLIVGIVIIVLAVVLFTCEYDGAAFVLGIIGGYILSGAILMMQADGKPSAMDVYRGKTTLEITYRDSIAVDSVVVFKETE